MIYLIGGTPRCGKTTVAIRLSKISQIPWISVDTIESMISKYIPQCDRQRLFPKSNIRVKTKNSNDIMYSTYSTEDIKQSYINQAKTSWDAIRTFVQCEINNGYDYILEGHQIHPQLINNLVSEYGNSIKPLILTRLDKEKTILDCKQNKAANDWFIDKTKDEQTFYLIAEMLKAYSDFFEKQSKKYNIKTINMDADFKTKAEESVKYLQLKPI